MYNHDLITMKFISYTYLFVLIQRTDMQKIGNQTVNEITCTIFSQGKLVCNLIFDALYPCFHFSDRELFLEQ